MVCLNLSPPYTYGDHLDAETAGTGAFVYPPSGVLHNHAWGHGQEWMETMEAHRRFASVPGPLQNVQDASGHW